MHITINPETMARFKKAAHKAEQYNSTYLTWLIRQELQASVTKQ